MKKEANNNPLVSIGIPVVKSNFLKDAIISCLNQSYSRIEIIIQSNAKELYVKKEIRNIVKEINDTRIEFFETETQIPMVENWNQVLSKASGDFFAILCDDDSWDVNFIEEMISLSNKYPRANIFHSRVAFVDESSERFSVSPICPEYEDGLDFIYHRIAKFRSLFLSDFLVKKTPLIEIGGFVNLPDGWGSDDLTWFKLALRGGVGYSHLPLYNYRVSTLNVTNKGSIKNKLLAIERQYHLITNLMSSPEISHSDIRYLMILDKLKKYRGKRKGYFYEKKFVGYWLVPRLLAKILCFVWLYIYSKKHES